MSFRGVFLVFLLIESSFQMCISNSCCSSSILIFGHLIFSHRIASMWGDDDDDDIHTIKMSRVITHYYTRSFSVIVENFNHFNCMEFPSEIFPQSTRTHVHTHQTIWQSSTGRTLLSTSLMNSFCFDKIPLFFLFFHFYKLWHQI